MNPFTEGLSWLLVALTLPGTLLLAVLTVAALWPKRAVPGRPACRIAHLAVVVPAHNEEALIARTVASLAADSCPGTELVVVADNCTDRTAEFARQAGARVLERNDPLRRGKGFALDFAFARLRAEGIDALVVVDGDSVVARGFVGRMRRALECGADAAQAVYLPLGEPSSPGARVVRVARVAWNVVRLAGRQRLGVSVGILGNGFALTAATLAAVPYSARSIVEDLEYHVALVRAGYRVHLVPDAQVAGDMPVAGAARATQRARWEGGRLRVLVDHGGTLLRDVFRGRWRSLEPLVDLALPPLAVHVTLLLAATALGSGHAHLLALAGLGVIAVHVLVAVVLGGGGWRDAAALAVTPLYVLRKLVGLGDVLRAARPDTPWVRTARGNRP